MKTYPELAQTQLPTSDILPLARIENAADELARIGNYIEGFLDRFRGNERAVEPALAPVPCGHIGQIERLTTNLHRVDCLARDLQTIG